jgi:hypothetical protein
LLDFASLYFTDAYNIIVGIDDYERACRRFCAHVERRHASMAKLLDLCVGVGLSERATARTLDQIYREMRDERLRLNVLVDIGEHLCEMPAWLHERMQSSHRRLLELRAEMMHRLIDAE